MLISLREISRHGPDVIEQAIIYLIELSEEAQEDKNKDIENT